MRVWVFERFPSLWKPLGRGQSTALRSSAHLRELTWCTGGGGGGFTAKRNCLREMPAQRSKPWTLEVWQGKSVSPSWALGCKCQGVTHESAASLEHIRLRVGSDSGLGITSLQHSSICTGDTLSRGAFHSFFCGSGCLEETLEPSQPRWVLPGSVAGLSCVIRKHPSACAHG